MKSGHTTVRGCDKAKRNRRTKFNDFVTRQKLADGGGEAGSGRTGSGKKKTIGCRGEEWNFLSEAQSEPIPGVFAGKRSGGHLARPVGGQNF